MRTNFKMAITAGLAMVMSGMSFAPRANAQCAGFGALNEGAVQSLSWRGAPQFDSSFLFLVVNQGRADDRIVGFWKAKFLAKGNANIPDGTLIDSPFVQWHSDGTEIMNSSRVPATQSYCLGVWKHAEQSDYELNHFALSFDSAGNFVGPAQIRENITLDQKADEYTGTFTIDQYDAAGNLLVEIVGQVTAMRITVDTTIDQVL